jgi:GNAT superfamily N-acetyltransferase
VSTKTGAAEIEVRIATGDEGFVGGHRVRDRALVAFIDGTPVGVTETHAQFYGHLFIELLIVDDRHRRRGVATALIAACAATAPTSKLFTSTNTSNLAAQELFLRAGFEACGSIDQLDEGDPEIVYCKLLDASRGMPT